jgi:hypothetical protein
MLLNAFTFVEKYLTLITSKYRMQHNEQGESALEI